MEKMDLLNKTKGELMELVIENNKRTKFLKGAVCKLCVMLIVFMIMCTYLLFTRN